MYRQTVRKPASVQTRKKEQVTQKAPVAASNSLSLQKIASYASSAKSNPQSSGAAAKAPVNLTGLPGNLKAGVEALSGFSLDNVRVHYNSPEPKKLNARAYTRGTDIYVGTGQERSLPHEAWHVVQQLQDRVRPTKKINSFNVNDSVQLEREADIMGARALSACKGGNAAPAAAELSQGTVQCDDWKSITLRNERKKKNGSPGSANPDLTHSLHHMLSRERLNRFCDNLSAQHQEEIISRFQHRQGRLTDGRDFRRILLSTRSNLVLGPDPCLRDNDPGSGFDPTYGDYAPVSKVYEQIDRILRRPDYSALSRGERDKLNSKIISLLAEAETKFKRIQEKKGLPTDMINTDIDDLWEKDKGGKYRKKKPAPFMKRHPYLTGILGAGLGAGLGAAAGLGAVAGAAVGAGLGAVGSFLARFL